MIKTVMKNSAAKLPEEPVLEVLEAKCLNNFERDPNPRSKCWKVIVPYRFKELMESDELYPSGWSHRRFFPPKRNPGAPNGQPAKRSNIDPIADMLRNGGGGATPSVKVTECEEQIDLC